MKLLLISAILCLSLISRTNSALTYKVVVSRYSQTPLLSNASGSAWNFNYNSAAYIQDDQIQLMVRSQNLKNQSEPFSVGPSYLTSSTVTINKVLSANATQATSVAFGPDGPDETCGTEDPRIALYNGTYYMFYTAYDCSQAMLSLATSLDPSDPYSWTRHGFVFPDKGESKSAAALFATKDNQLTQHYLFWGDTDISIAVSNDTINWQDTGKFLIPRRNDSFDSALCESGPPPLRLSSGDYLFVYNSARHGYPSVKGDWDLQYNVGFVILNGSDPTQVIHRNDDPIMSPDNVWEIGNSTDYLTPNVVFLEGLVPLDQYCSDALEEYKDTGYAGLQCFFGVYGGSDSDLGAVRIIVYWTNSDDVQDEDKVEVIDV